MLCGVADTQRTMVLLDVRSSPRIPAAHRQYPFPTELDEQQLVYHSIAEGQGPSLVYPGIERHPWLSIAHEAFSNRSRGDPIEKKLFSHLTASGVDMHSPEIESLFKSPLSRIRLTIYFMHFLFLRENSCESCRSAYSKLASGCGKSPIEAVMNSRSAYVACF